MRIVAPHFVAGIVLQEEHACRCAPIVNYMLGWTRERIERYCAGKRWRVEECSTTAAAPVKIREAMARRATAPASALTGIVGPSDIARGGISITNILN
jgi:hypothetical protein